MDKNQIRLIILFLFLLTTFNNVNATKKLNIQIAAEAGGYHSHTLSSDYVSRLIGRINYRNNFDKNYLLLKARFAPEFYGFENSTSAYKLTGDFIFGQAEKNYAWQTRIMYKNYFYLSSSYDDIFFNSLLIGGRTTLPIKSKFSIQWELDYLYRDTSSKPHNRLDSILGNFLVTYRLLRATYLGLEIYLEKFYIECANTRDLPRKNQGWRFGPKVSLQHKSTYIFNITYHFIRHYSKLGDEFSNEHRLQLIWGRILLNNWSLFMYVNYHYKDQYGDKIPVVLTYSPLNNENWYYLKLGYDITKSKEIYIKTGYVKDDLIYWEESLSGWQALLGLNWEL